MGIYGIEMTQWQEDQGAFWDDAVRGSSALQAALKRRMLDEIETHELGTSITGYCDLEKFYDSIDISKLIMHAMACGFPPSAMALLLQVHRGTRLLRVNKWVSEPITPIHVHRSSV